MRTLPHPTHPAYPKPGTLRASWRALWWPKWEAFSARKANRFGVPGKAVNILPYWLITPAHVLTLFKARNWDRLEYLVIDGLDVNMDFSKQSPYLRHATFLGLAIETLRSDLVRMLLERGARFDRPMTGVLHPAARLTGNGPPWMKPWDLLPASPWAILLDVEEYAYLVLTHKDFDYSSWQKVSEDRPAATQIMHLLFNAKVPFDLRDSGGLYTPGELLQDLPLSHRIRMLMDGVPPSKVPSPPPKVAALEVLPVPPPIKAPLTEESLQPRPPPEE